MATNRAIRRALLAKLDVTPSRLSQRAKQVKAFVPMSTEQAHYVLAHEEGIDIARELPKEEVAEVRDLVAHYRAANGSLPTPTANGKATTRKAKAMPKTAQVSIRAANAPKLSVITSVHAGEAKVMSERVYPRLYLFENSLRDVIERVLKDAHGPGWWSTVPKRVQEKAAEHKTAEGRDAWHGKRGGRDIDYTFLTQLWDVIKDQWKLFKHLFPSQSWIENLITNDMNVSRRVVAHMNPLDDDDVKGIEVAYSKWAKQLREKIEPNLP